MTENEKYPDWCEVTDSDCWEDFTIEKAQFIHEQAERCFSDILDGYKALKQRCISLMTLNITIISGLLAFVLSSKIPMLQIYSIALISLLTVSTFFLIKSFYGYVVPTEGQLPESLCKKAFIKKQSLQGLILVNIRTIQAKINELKDIKKKINNGLWIAYSIFLLSPIIAIISFFLVRIFL